MSGAEKDLYQVLGVDAQASESEIQKAYRKLARAHHPDKASAKGETERKADEAKIRDINAAYDVLSSKEKRTQYDSMRERPNFDQIFRQNWPQGGHGQDPEEADLSSWVERIFGGNRGFGGGRETSRGRTPGAAVKKIQLPLRALIKGGEFKTKEGLRYQLPSGLAVGSRLRLGASEVQVELTLPADFYAEANGQLHAKLRVWPTELITGAQKQLTHPDKEGEITLRLPHGSQPNVTSTFKGRGLPKGDGTRGDLIVSLIVRYPRVPSTEVETLARKLTEKLEHAADL